MALKISYGRWDKTTPNFSFHLKVLPEVILISTQRRYFNIFERPASAFPALACLVKFRSGRLALIRVHKRHAISTRNIYQKKSTSKYLNWKFRPNDFPPKNVISGTGRAWETGSQLSELGKAPKVLPSACEGALQSQADRFWRAPSRALSGALFGFPIPTRLPGQDVLTVIWISHNIFVSLSAFSACHLTEADSPNIFGALFGT